MPWESNSNGKKQPPAHHVERSSKKILESVPVTGSIPKLGGDYCGPRLSPHPSLTKIRWVVFVLSCPQTNQPKKAEVIHVYESFLGVSILVFAIAEWPSVHGRNLAGFEDLWV